MELQELFNLPHRPFTTSEEADISCNLPEFCDLEEDYLYHPSGDKLHAVGDNLYRVSRYEMEQALFFENLMEAVKALPLD